MGSDFLSSETRFSEQITHVPVSQMQDLVEYNEPLAIGDMVLVTSGNFSHESYRSGVWRHRDQLVKLTNKRRRMAE